MDWRPIAAVAALAALTAGALAGPAFADEVTDLKAEMEALKRQLAEQERRLRDLSPTRMSNDEITAALDRYLSVSSAQAPVTLVGGEEPGKAGFPMGKKPFISQGPNKLEIAFRNQVRYEWFNYSDDAVGTLSDTGNPVADQAPRDRSGFEIERLYIGFDGTIFCPDITYKLELNFDNDSGTGVEKRYAYIDWKYSGEHHVRAGADKVASQYEEQNSSSALAFVDRSIASKAFEIGFDQGLALWGYFGGCECPKRFLYKFQAQNGEGAIQRGSPFNTDAFDTYADTLLYAGMLEWNLSPCCPDFKWDEVDHRPCDKRGDLLMALGVAGYYENDDDFKKDQWGGLKVRSSDKAERYGLGAWFRAHWNGWSLLAEGFLRNIDYTKTSAGVDSTKPTQEDTGLHVMLHHRFAESNWGIGVRYGIIWIDDDYTSITQGPVGNQTTVDFEDTITEAGVVVNYFFHDHNNKVSFDVNWVQDNSGVSSSSAGYLVDPAKGVVIEDGVFFRLQWQLNF